MYKVTYNEHNGDMNNPGYTEKVAYVDDIISMQKYRNRILRIEPMAVTYLPEFDAKLIQQVYQMIDQNIKATK